MLSIFFCIVAFFYSMVGFGGGSSYIALLVLFETPYQHIPILALICNLIVVSGGLFHFIRSKHFSLSLTWPFVVASVPAAFIGGMVVVDRNTFLLVLGFCLGIAGIKMLVNVKRESKVRMLRLYFALPIGALIGFVSGLVGIGGGIFLAPILHIFHIGKTKSIAATASAFIFVNSCAGLIGQLQKYDFQQEILYNRDYVFLLAAVFLGGQLGSLLSTHKIPTIYVKRLTAVLVLYVSGKILVDLFF